MGAPHGGRRAATGASTDESLMQRYRRGDVVAFDELYGRHKNGVYRYLLRGCGGDAQAAAELAQDIWANVIRAAPQYEPTAAFSTWLYRLAHNRLVDHYRASQLKAEPLRPDAPFAAPEHERPDVQAEAQSIQRRIVAAVQGLPLLQREAFMLQQDVGLTLDNIAAITGVGRETVKSRLRYALVHLRGVLADVL